MNKNKTISNLTCFMAFMIMVFHSYNLGKYGFSTDLGGGIAAVCYIEKVLNQFGNLGVATFFVLSGYLFFVGLGSDSFSRLEKKLSSRFVSIALPYLIWTVIYFILFAVIPKLPVGFSINTEAIELSIPSFFFCIWNSISHLWYLRVLMCCFVVSPILFIVVKKMLKNKVTHILLYLTVVLYVGFENVISANTPINSFFCWFYFYLLGAILAQDNWLLEFVRKLQNSIVFGIVGIVVYVLLGVFIYGTSAKFANLTLGCLAISTIISLMTNRLNLSLELPVNTFWLYMVHYIVLVVISKLFYVILGVNARGAIINYFVTPWLTLGICIVSGLLVKKIWPVGYRVATGGR